MPTFETSFTVRASLEAVANFHCDTRALKTLSPPPIVVQLHHVEPLAEGSISEFTLWFGPLPVRWKARHQNVDPLHGFTDEQISGPMQYWRHTHSFTELDNGQVRITDQINYEHYSGPRGLFSRVLFAPIGLNFLFFYRELATRRVVESA
jgi:ligand-binding SRPBCC domain-containing protein